LVLDPLRVRRRLSLEDAAALHGHKGPWLILGYKAGERAIEVLKPLDEADLECTVKGPLRTPYTCSADGIQAASKCTIGKLNIRLEESEEVEYVFKLKSTGRVLVLRPRPSVLKRLRTEPLLEAARFVEGAEHWELFEERG